MARTESTAIGTGGSGAVADRVEKVGVMHVHTRYSDGKGDVQTVARAAARAGADFVAVTDHDSLAGLHNGEEGWYGTNGRPVDDMKRASTLIFVGQEISPEDGNHFLAFGLNETVSKNQPPDRYVREVARSGGIGFIAHPVYPSPDRYPLKTFPWTRWDVTGYSGMEIWTYSVDWLVDVTTVPRLLAALSFPDRFVNGPCPEALARWDELCRDAWRRGRKVVGIGSTDAHGFLYSYRRMFKTVRTHVLLEDDWSGDGARDKSAVLAALRAGHAYVAYDALHDATGFRFTAEGTGLRVHMGGTVRWRRSAGELSLRVTAPVPCTLTLRTVDGIAARAESDRMEYRVTAPGVYRVEAHLSARRGPRPWVFTNPIYIR